MIYLIISVVVLGGAFVLVVMSMVNAMSIREENDRILEEEWRSEINQDPK